MQNVNIIFAEKAEIMEEFRAIKIEYKDGGYTSGDDSLKSFYRIAEFPNRKLAVVVFSPEDNAFKFVANLTGIDGTEAPKDIQKHLDATFEVHRDGEKIRASETMPVLYEINSTMSNGFWTIMWPTFIGPLLPGSKYTNKIVKEGE